MDDLSGGLFACLYEPPGRDGQTPLEALREIAQGFSPRFEIDRADLVSIDVGGLARLLGSPETIAGELRHAAAARGLRAHVAVAGTRTAAMVVAQARPGVTVVARGEEAAALAPLAIGILEKAPAAMPAAARHQRGGAASGSDVGVGPHVREEVPHEKLHNLSTSIHSAVSVFRSWGLRTLGDLAALPPADLASRLGRAALGWQAIARGDDLRPLIPAIEEERFESSLELEWPIEGLEPLSFVLTRLLEPLSTRLERRDRGAAVLHVVLRLITREVHPRRLELPTPMRDVRTLRTLALLDLESHPPAAAIDRVAVVVDPTPGRVLQHTLFTRPQPTPEQLSTLIARLGAVMGQDRVGAPSTVDSYRPGAFEMTAFFNARGASHAPPERESRRSSAREELAMASALRRCRQPVPARVVVEDGRPVRLTTDRRGFSGGAVVRAAGPWRVSGHWWVSGCEGGAPRATPESLRAFNRDEWDVALADGALYVVFRDRETERWFIDAIID